MNDFRVRRDNCSRGPECVNACEDGTGPRRRSHHTGPRDRYLLRHASARVLARRLPRRIGRRMAILSGLHLAPDAGTNRRIFPIYLRHLLSMPLRRPKRRFATARTRHATFPFHVLLRQLAHCANFRDNSNLESHAGFLDLVLADFAKDRVPITTSS